MGLPSRSLLWLCLCFVAGASQDAFGFTATIDNPQANSWYDPTSDIVAAGVASAAGQTLVVKLKKGSVIKQEKTAVTGDDPLHNWSVTFHPTEGSPEAWPTGTDWSIEIWKEGVMYGSVAFNVGTPPPP